MSELFKHNVVYLSNPDRDFTVVEVGALGCSGEEWEIPLTDAILQLTAILGSIPQEYLDSARLKIVGYGDYVSLSDCVSYTRPETDAEMMDRKRWLNSLDEERELRDAREFERLKKKFSK